MIENNILPEQPDNNIDENKWNPFIPTKRDIKRTDELAEKNPTVAGILTFLFPIAGLIYLNRGVNTLKIIGYVFAVSFVLALIAPPKENSDGNISNLIGLVGCGALTAEQIMAVNKAQERQERKNRSVVE